MVRVLESSLVSTSWANEPYSRYPQQQRMFGTDEIVNGLWYAFAAAQLSFMSRRDKDGSVGPREVLEGLRIPACQQHVNFPERGDAPFGFWHAMITADGLENRSIWT
ncbi:predicted protein [Chaetomium globosum CBS 148.51]|uniref:Uncharacterized protein n=1 Tax=Chaetomium globosum (strain ATCC 6205 / CBS 148.51 / DSM 1962 / NBRC 6347 / NRRL 1970) TaxID=306901 RepID=Q2H2K8_CHAGB|nr:uncharacterized protein CHGG_03988 [Chaetomium globosum CBS 148.51]EAQ87369.1 predicted protein [Chaetomium globosum CBS 148.51]